MSLTEDIFTFYLDTCIYIKTRYSLIPALLLASDSFHNSEDLINYQASKK